MWRSAAVLVGLIAALSASPLSAALPVPASRTLTVCPQGPPICEFTTVQEALDAAHDGDRILISPGTYDGGFTVDKSVSLIGSGQSQTTVSGGQDVLSVSAGSTVEIRGLAILSATDTGLVNDGTLTLYSSLVAGNLDGVGIHNQNLATLTIEDSSLLDNCEGFWNQGSATISDTQLTGNCGPSDAFFNSGRLVLRRSVLSDNAGFSNSGVTIATDCVFDALSDDGGSGIWNGGRFELTRSVIEHLGGDTSAVDNSGTMNVSDSRVVANYDVALANEGDLTLWRTTVAQNQGDYNGGGIRNSAWLKVGQSNVSENTSGDGAGGIYNSGTAVLSYTTVRGNIATDGGNGGGIDNEGGTLELSYTMVDGNTAAYAGGGIYNTGTAALSHSWVTGNTAEGISNLFGGGIYNIGTIGLEHSVVRLNVPDDCVGC